MLAYQFAPRVPVDRIVSLTQLIQQHNGNYPLVRDKILMEAAGVLGELGAFMSTKAHTYCQPLYYEQQYTGSIYDHAFQIQNLAYSGVEVEDGSYGLDHYQVLEIVLFVRRILSPESNL